MSVINTGNFPKGLKESATKWVMLKDERYAPVYKHYFEEVKSEDMYEEYTNAVGPGVASIKPQGQPMALGDMRQGNTMRLTNAIVALGLQITYEEIKNNKYPALTEKRGTGVREGLMEAKEVLHASIRNNAFNALYKGMDGQPLCSLTHLTVNGQIQANTPAVSAGLSEKTLEDMCIMAISARAENGFVKRVDPHALIVGNGDWFRATRILKSVKQSGTANNDLNAIRELGVLPGGLILDKFQTVGSNAWGVTTRVPKGEGFITQQRESLQTRQDNVTSTLDFLMYAFEYYACGFVDWRCYYGANAS